MKSRATSPPPNGVGTLDALDGMRRFRASADHELPGLGEGMRLPEDEVCDPFRLTPTTEGCHPTVDFELLFDRGHFDTNIGAEAGSAV